MKFTTTSYLSNPPVYDMKQGITTLPGGFLLVITGLQSLSILPAGSAFVADETARTATLLKSTLVYANATNVATTIQVTKGTQFAVGDNIGKADGAKSIDITAIDRTNAGYDIITVSATLGYALTAGDTLVQASNANASAVILKPNGLLYNDVVVDTNSTVTLVTGAVAYKRRIPPIIAASMAALPNVIFTNSK